MPERAPRLHYIILPLAALIAIFPLILNGCSCGHDFDFHILNWFEAARQFAHGNLHPHWAYTPAFNAGEPRFIFYPPISWTIGAVLGLILPHALGGWLWTPIIYTWLALTAAGLSLYYVAKEFASHHAALFAATIYIVNPYTLFTAYERTAYSELLAAAWIPLLLHAILREKVTIPRIAIPVALLWLTNAPAAVMSCYALAILTLIRLATNSGASRPPGAPSLASETWDIVAKPRPSSLQLAATTTAGTILGLGLAAFYIVPAACERRYVHIAMAILPGMAIHDNFLFHHTPDPDHDLVLRTASIVALIVIAITAATLIATRRATTPGAPHLDSEMWESSEGRPLSSPSPKNPGAPSFAHHAKGGIAQPSLVTILAILTLIIAFLLTPLSAPIWNHVPELLYLQFPWRLIAILAAVMALAIATAITRLKLKPIQTTAIALAIAAALTTAAYTLFHQPCDEEDTVPARLALFHSNAGTDPTDEYTPITADNDALSHTNPAYWLAQNPTAKAPATSTPAPTPTHLTVTTPIPQTLILNLRNYPIWRITSNDVVITTREPRKDGLIAIPLPAGSSNISITSTQPPGQTIGDILTALAAALLLLTFRKPKPATTT